MILNIIKSTDDMQIAIFVFKMSGFKDLMISINYQNWFSILRIF